MILYVSIRWIKRFLTPFLLALVLFSMLRLLHLRNQPNSLPSYEEQIVHNHPRAHVRSFKTKIYPNYYEDNLHPNWTFNISKTYDEKLLRHWNQPIRVVNKSHLWSQGENGTAFIPPIYNSELDSMEKIQRENNYNIFASDKISLHRSLPDYRFPECRKLAYPEKLPTVSVIIAVHNEAWSTLLRTVWSIIDRSPRELLHEIILVEDASTWPFLKRPLDDYVELLPVNIRVIHTDQREGLIRARLIGAKHAKGNVLTFFDAHVECTEGWLEPILARIASDRSVIAIPIIDSIDSNDMSYSANRLVEAVGFRWHLLFSWIDIPKREILRTKNDKTAPIRTPSHIGSAFSIDREFFFEIGSFDEKMDIWGSENVELAFRVWMCGGSLEILPCSRVGHLFRLSTFSYIDNEFVIRKRNNVRLVEVWMDEFKNMFYAAKPSSKYVPCGDLTERKKLRENLKCKNFRWYLENIYPESSFFKEYIMMGKVESMGGNGTCLDINLSVSKASIMLWPCHSSGGNQFFAFAKSGQIVTAEDICMSVKKRLVILVQCSGEDKNQLWNYDSEKQWIGHRESNLCLRNNQTAVILGKCNPSDTKFQWNVKYTVPKNAIN